MSYEDYKDVKDQSDLCLIFKAIYKNKRKDKSLDNIDTLDDFIKFLRGLRCLGKKGYNLIIEGNNICAVNTEYF